VGTDGKLWEIAWGELCWEGAEVHGREAMGNSVGRAGKERDGSDDRVDGGESLRWIDWGILYWGELRWEGARWKRRHSARTGNSKNSSGRGPLGGSDILRSRAVGTGCQDKFHQRNGSEKLCAQDLSSGLKMLINVGRSDMRSFVGRERR
jgi:hypothetical protein